MATARSSRVPTTYPDHASPQNTFYGIDIVYTATGGNTPPTIVGMTVVADGLSVTSTINATDNETLAGATYSWVWGDGRTPVACPPTPRPTPTPLAAPTRYWDPGHRLRGLSDYAARPIILVSSAAGFDAASLTNLLVSMAQQTGLFTRSLATNQRRCRPLGCPQQCGCRLSALTGDCPVSRPLRRAWNTGCGSTHP